MNLAPPIPLPTVSHPLANPQLRLKPIVVASTSAQQASLHDAPPAYADYQWSDLLNLTFQVPQGQSFLSDFPIWDPNFLVPERTLWGLFTPQNQLIAGCGIRLAHVPATDSPQQPLAPRATRLIALLGAVATHPAWQNQRLASHLIQHAVAWALARNACAVFLWSSRPQLYARLGFQPCGEQALVELQAVVCPAFPQALELQAGFTQEIFALLQNREDGLCLQPHDWAWFSSHRNTRWLSSFLPAQPIEAYAAIGRGIDLGSIIHEWGGTPEGLATVFQTLLREDPQACLLGTPRHFQRLTAAGFRLPALHREPVCLGFLTEKFPNPLCPEVWFWGLDGA